MTAEKSAPIAVFAYNRLDHFEKMFAALKNCRGFDKSPVTIFIDGAKSEKDALQVEKVRAFARSINLPNVNIIDRPTNMGLKASIFDGVGRLCKEYGRVIVLEDDLIVAPCILEYFNNALDKYQDEERIWSVVGYQYDVPKLRNRDTALILPFAHCWGWATWDRTWSQFDINAPIDPATLKSRTFQSFFDACGVRDFRDMLELETQGKINSWFIRWYYKIFSERGACVFPPITYVTNIGMGAEGTHASALSPYSRLVHPAPPQDAPITLPDEFKIDYIATDKIRKSWDARVQNMIGYIGRLKRIVLGLCSK